MAGSGNAPGDDFSFTGACYHHGDRKMLCEVPGCGAIERTPDYGEKYPRCGRFCGRGKSRKTLINQGFAASFLSRDVAKYVAKRAKTKNEVLRMHAKELQNAQNMYKYNKNQSFLTGFSGADTRIRTGDLILTNCKNTRFFRHLRAQKGRFFLLFCPPKPVQKVSSFHQL